MIHVHSWTFAYIVIKISLKITLAHCVLLNNDKNYKTLIISGDCCLLNDDAFQKCSDCECLYDPVEIMSTAKHFPSGMFSKTDGMIAGMEGLTYGQTDFSRKMLF